MALQLIFELERVRNPSIELDRGVSSNGEELPVGGEGMVRNRVVEEMVYFWSGHYGGSDRSSSLLSQFGNVRGLRSGRVRSCVVEDGDLAWAVGGVDCVGQA